MNSESINILHIIESLELGGAERVLVDIVNHLPKEFISHICCLKKSGVLANRISKENVTIYELHKQDKNDFLIPIRIKKILDNQKIDIIHAHNWNTFCESLIAAKIAGIHKVVHTIHGHHVLYPDTQGGRFKKKARHFVERILAKNSYRICSVSEAIMDYIIHDIGIPGDRNTVIINGIETDYSVRPKKEVMEEIGISDSEFVMCFVGRLDPVKNLSLLIRSVPLLLPKIKNLRLLLIGEGSERSMLEEQVKSSRIENHVTFLGYRDDVRDIMNVAHLFIITSHYEGISIAQLEAMAAGLPIVATDVGGNREIVIPEKTGFLTPAGDVDSLIKYILQLYEKPELRARMSENAQKRVVQNFSIRKTISQYVSIYKGIEKN